MIPDQFRNIPFGRSGWGLIAALVVAIILVLAYVEDPRLMKGAFALGSLALLGRQFRTFRSRGSLPPTSGMP
jgi:hypothetical protein